MAILMHDIMGTFFFVGSAYANVEATSGKEAQVSH